MLEPQILFLVPEHLGYITNMLMNLHNHNNEMLEENLEEEKIKLL